MFFGRCFLSQVIRRRVIIDGRVIFSFRRHLIRRSFRSLLVHGRGLHRILGDGLFLVIHRPKPFSWLFDPPSHIVSCRYG
ncbi:MAG TPA: hypothetical protein DIW51_16145 [Rhodospirillaceae bacterium]|nr:hypothetical protein [Rhodospirillaceae bacterium]